MLLQIIFHILYISWNLGVNGETISIFSKNFINFTLYSGENNERIIPIKDHNYNSTILFFLSPIPSHYPQNFKETIEINVHPYSPVILAQLPLHTNNRYIDVKISAAVDGFEVVDEVIVKLKIIQKNEFPPECQKSRYEMTVSEIRSESLDIVCFDKDNELDSAELQLMIIDVRPGQYWSFTITKFEEKFRISTYPFSSVNLPSNITKFFLKLLLQDGGYDGEYRSNIIEVIFHVRKQDPDGMFEFVWNQDHNQPIYLDENTIPGYKIRTLSLTVKKPENADDIISLISIHPETMNEFVIFDEYRQSWKVRNRLDRESMPIISVRSRATVKLYDGTIYEWYTVFEIFVNDFNDNSPQFLNFQSAIVIEGNVFRKEIFDQFITQFTAIDLDRDENGTVHYSIQSDYDYVKIIEQTGVLLWNRTLADFLKVFNSGESSSFAFTIQATDQSKITETIRSTLLPCHITFTIPNYERPMLRPKSVQLHISESHEIKKSVFNSLRGEDEETDVRYSFVSSTEFNVEQFQIQTLELPFLLDETNGEIYLVDNLDAEKTTNYKLYVVAYDLSYDRLFSNVSKIEIFVDNENDNIPQCDNYILHKTLMVNEIETFLYSNSTLVFFNCWDDDNWKKGEGIEFIQQSSHDENIIEIDKFTGRVHLIRLPLDREYIFKIIVRDQKTSENSTKIFELSNYIYLNIDYLNNISQWISQEQFTHSFFNKTQRFITQSISVLSTSLYLILMDVLVKKCVDDVGLFEREEIEKKSFSLHPNRFEVTINKEHEFKRCENYELKIGTFPNLSPILNIVQKRSMTNEKLDEEFIEKFGGIVRRWTLSESSMNTKPFCHQSNYSFKINRRILLTSPKRELLLGKLNCYDNNNNDELFVRSSNENFIFNLQNDEEGEYYRFTLRTNSDYSYDDQLYRNKLELFDSFNNFLEEEINVNIEFVRDDDINYEIDNSITIIRNISETTPIGTVVASIAPNVNWSISCSLSNPFHLLYEVSMTTILLMEMIDGDIVRRIECELSFESTRKILIVNIENENDEITICNFQRYSTTKGSQISQTGYNYQKLTIDWTFIDGDVDSTNNNNNITKLFCKDGDGIKNDELRFIDKSKLMDDCLLNGRVNDGNVVVFQAKDKLFSHLTSVSFECHFEISDGVHQIPYQILGEYRAFQQPIPEFGEDSLEIEAKEDVEVKSVIYDFDATASGISEDLVTYIIISNQTIFQIDARTGKLYIIRSLDRETEPFYTFYIIAKHRIYPKFADRLLVKLNVLDVQDSPPRLKKRRETISLEENDEKDIIYEVEVISEDINSKTEFFIKNLRDDVMPIYLMKNKDNSCLIRKKSSFNFDYEQQKFFVFHLIATDSRNVHFTDRMILNLKILDVNDNVPQFPFDDDHGEKVTSISIHIPENSEGPLQLRSNLKGVDADHKNSSNSQIFYRLLIEDDGYEDYFSFNENNFTLMLNDGKFVLDREKKEIYEMKLQISNFHETFHLFDELLFNLILSDINDNSPVFNEESLTIYVNEENQSNNFIGRIVVNDSDINENGEIDLNFIHKTQTKSKVSEDFILIINNKNSIYLSTKWPYAEEMKYNIIACDEPLNRTEQLCAEAILKIIKNFTDSSSNMKTFQLNENSPKWTEIEKNINVNVEEYDRSDNYTKLFELKTNKLILLSDHLDREEQSHYLLTFHHRTTQEEKRIEIKILDENDNSPRLLQNLMEIFEELDIGTSIGFINATDDDEGINREIKYEFSPNISSGSHRIREYFQMESNGELIIKKLIDYENVKQFVDMIHLSDNGIKSNEIDEELTIKIINVLDPNSETFFINKEIPEMKRNEFIQLSKLTKRMKEIVQSNDEDPFKFQIINDDQFTCSSENDVNNCRIATGNLKNNIFLSLVVSGNGTQLMAPVRLDIVEKENLIKLKRSACLSDSERMNIEKLLGEKYFNEMKVKLMQVNEEECSSTIARSSVDVEYLMWIIQNNETERLQNIDQTKNYLKSSTIEDKITNKGKLLSELESSPYNFHEFITFKDNSWRTYTIIVAVVLLVLIAGVIGFIFARKKLKDKKLLEEVKSIEDLNLEKKNPLEDAEKNSNKSKSIEDTKRNKRKKKKVKKPIEDTEIKSDDGERNSKKVKQSLGGKSKESKKLKSKTKDGKKNKTSHFEDELKESRTNCDHNINLSSSQTSLEIDDDAGVNISKRKKNNRHKNNTSFHTSRQTLSESVLRMLNEEMNKVNEDEHVADIDRRQERPSITSHLFDDPKPPPRPPSYNTATKFDNALEKEGKSKKRRKQPPKPKPRTKKSEQNIEIPSSNFHVKEFLSDMEKKERMEKERPKTGINRKRPKTARTIIRNNKTPSERVLVVTSSGSEESDS